MMTVELVMGFEDWDEADWWCSHLLAHGIVAWQGSCEGDGPWVIWRGDLNARADADH